MVLCQKFTVGLNELFEQEQEQEGIDKSFAEEGVNSESRN